MANISFGTDGFRGILGEDFNMENVKIIIIVAKIFQFLLHLVK